MMMNMHPAKSSLDPRRALAPDCVPKSHDSVKMMSKINIPFTYIAQAWQIRQ